MNSSFFHFALLLFLVEISSESRFILKFKLFDYNNLRREDNNCKKSNGCRLRFGICLSSSSDKKCDIFQKETRSFTKIYKIGEVFNAKIGLSNLTKNFYIDVAVVKERSQNLSWTTQIYTYIKDPMINSYVMGFLTTKQKYKENHELQYKFVFLCAKGYYGDKCEKICDKTPFELCLMNDCKRDCIYGQCKWDSIKNLATCICEYRWRGKDCSIKVEICKPNQCNYTDPVCRDEFCYCQNVAEDKRIYCLQDKDPNRNNPVKNISKIKQPNYIYTLAIITVIFGILGMLGFISITVSRFCIDRRSKKKHNTVFYHNSNEDMVSIDTVDSDTKEPK